MRNAIVIISITAFVLFIVFGILYGWFRTPPKLSDTEIASVNEVGDKTSATINEEDVRSIFSKLWYDHVRLTREVILGIFGNSPNVNVKENELLDNQTDIGNAINMFYPQSASIITSTLRDHILQAKVILEDLKYKRLAKLPSDIIKWYNNADKFADIMNEINPAWNLKEHMEEHLRITEREAVYEWLGAKELSSRIYNEKVVPQAQEIVEIITRGLK